MDSPVVTDVLTKAQVEQIIDERDGRLKAEISSMLDAKFDAKFASFEHALADKASHSDVDAAIAKVIAPIQEQLGELKKMLGELITKKDVSDRDVAYIRGTVEALTHVKSADMQMIRDRQVDTDRQVDVIRVGLVGVAGDVGLLMSDVRGAGKGDGNPSLFELLNAVRNDVQAMNIRVGTVQQTHAVELAAVRAIVDADHKFVNAVRSLGMKSAKAALAASWKAFLQQSVGVKVTTLTVTILGTILANGVAQGWIEPVLVWLLEQMK